MDLSSGVNSVDNNKAVKSSNKGDEVQKKELVSRADTGDGNSIPYRSLMKKYLLPGLLVAIGLILSLISIRLYLSPHSYQAGADYLNGVMIISFLVISAGVSLAWWAVWNASKYKDNKYGLIILGSTFLVLSIFILSAQIGTGINAEKKEKLVSRKIYEMYKNNYKPSELKNENFDEKTYGAASPAAEFARDYYVEVSELAAVHLKSEKNDYGEIFTKKTLGYIGNIVLLKGKLRITAKELAAYRKGLEEVYNKYNERTDSLNLPGDYKNKFFKSFVDSTVNSQRSMLQAYDLKIKAFEKTIVILDFFEQRQGKYGFVRDALYFGSEKDSVKYDTLFNELKAISKQHKQVAESAENEIKGKRSEFEKLYNELYK